MNYRKEIHITDTGMVVASVYSDDGRRVGLKFFTSLIRSTARIELQATKAHRWADKHIAMCQKQET